MANIDKRRQVLELRKLGKSYSQIKTELGISKSTLSVWLRKYPLTREQINLLRANSEVRIEKYRQTMKRKREKRLLDYYNNEKKSLLPMSKRELLIAGIFLYWGEGDKTSSSTISINNTDPTVLQFALYWMREALDIPKDKIHVSLHLYDDMVIEDITDFWSKTLNIPKSQFVKPYIKKSSRTELDHKGFGYGTCGLRVYNTVIKEKTLMAIKAMADYSEAKIPTL